MIYPSGAVQKVALLYSAEIRKQWNRREEIGWWTLDPSPDLCSPLSA